MSQTSSEIILFNYPESVFGRRTVRYLNLRGLSFSQIRVPPNMPRPILQERLGINYRRIPIMAIGRDVYIDTRLMLRKLETLYPEGKLGSNDTFEQGLEDILEEFVIDAGPFVRTAGCIPMSAPLVNDKVWMKDRSDGSGGMFSRDALIENRSWSLSQLRLYFGMMEKILGDGREWIFNGSRPGLAEVHVAWVYDWAVNMAGDMGGESDDSTADLKRMLNKDEFPRIHEWVQRFRKACERAESLNSGAGAIDEGQEKEDDVVKRILGGGLEEPDVLAFDDDDVLGLSKGQEVSVSPVDFGFTHQDVGTLIGLTKDEVVIETGVPGKSNGKLRLHYPRMNFKIKAVD
ncbi:uncharacterized protein LTR77_000900 [Saxophila tyrrhenica]|uniref:GST N-terminal domain-containing protein n=1 Tax=Saxophila tyrrhenica TaxID=1690608 RepID=A0AAV9PTU2_9PEZI|nr:hypothetical protein LTR77_000900 [Saxophila tyrrhenica]